MEAFKISVHLYIATIGEVTYDTQQVWKSTFGYFMYTRLTGLELRHVKFKGGVH